MAALLVVAIEPAMSPPRALPREKIRPFHPVTLFRKQTTTSGLSDLKEIGCKSAWPVHISPLSWAIERLLPGETVKICPRPAEFSLRFFKSDRLLEIRHGMRL